MWYLKASRNLATIASNKRYFCIIFFIITRAASKNADICLAKQNKEVCSFQVDKNEYHTPK